MAERHQTPRYVPDVEPAPEPEPDEMPDVETEPEVGPAPTPVVPLSPQTMPSAHMIPAPGAPTLTAAFTVLCCALQGQLGDNQVLAQHCDEIQAWMENSGGDIHSNNSIMAWRHSIQVLSEVLGQPMVLT